MSVATILRRKGSTVWTIQPEAAVAQAAHEMSARGIGALPVVDNAGRLLGIISERDIVRCIANKGASALDARVADAMTAEVETASLPDTVAEVMERMTNGRFRHLPVVEGGRLAGMVSIGDIVKQRLEDQELEVDTLRGFVNSIG
ncbi:MAG TPA: CBS domain-containing protein [Azospirillaceae bacterium]|nr:CBS domain-containing protein [Azospirillaceae bacterium]